MNHLTTRNALLGVLGSAVVFSLPVSVARADGGNDGAPASGQTPVANATQPAVEVAPMGAVIAKDKKTGELRPATAKEMRKLRKAAARQAAASGDQRPKQPVETRLSNGAVVTTLDSSYDVYSVATRGADGKVHTTCVPAEKVDSVLNAAQNGNQTKKETLDEK